MKKNQGSVQVMELSYVLPIAFTAVIGILYLAFLLFFYVYSVSVAGSYAEEALFLSEHSERLYWQLSAESLDKEDRKNLEASLKTKMKKMEVLPGISFSASFSEAARGRKLQVKIGCSYFGKPCFLVSAERTAYHPREFAKNVDLAGQFLKESELLQSIQTKYRSYLKKEQQYEGE